MSKTNGQKKLKGRGFFRPLLVTALAVSSSFNMISAVLAEGTTAGTTISNTATATYTDPDNKILNTTSNTVEVTVAEVAGITITNTDIRNTLEEDGTTAGDGEFEPGDTLVYEFEIKNVGNDSTKFSLTETIGFSGPVEDIVEIRYDSNGDGVIDNTDAVVSGTAETLPVDVGGTVLVEVTVKVDPNAVIGDDVTVTLGDTTGDGQNQPYDASANSVFTVDNTTAVTGEADETQAPANGEREASSTATITLGGQPTPKQPLVTILKSVDSITDTGVADDVSDDTVAYTLTVDMQDTPPAGSDVIASDLEPITINVNGSDEQHVLVSDAIPVDTVLATEPTGLPSGWQVVYTGSPVSGEEAIDADWFTTVAGVGTLEDVTRVGFIFTANTALSKTAANVNFSIEIQNTASNTANEIANIAQVFGAAQPDDPSTPSVDESLNHPVVDESGDTTPSNYDDTDKTYGGVDPENPNTDGTIPGTFDPTDGQVDDPTTLTNSDIDGGGATPGDPNDDHSGTPEDGKGEPVLVELTAPTTADIGNGPDGQPNAVGPTGTDDDFTNKSVLGGPGVDPEAVGFTNTVSNDSSVTGDIQLVPEDPGTTTSTDPAYLPDGTTVTIRLVDGTDYVYELTGGTWSAPVNASGNSVSDPVINDLPAGDTQNYTVQVDLPNDSTVDLEDYPVTIAANLDVDNNGTFDDGTNKTIDRIYTGFLQLVKTATVAQGDGPAVTGDDPAPGNHIVYQVEYTNISLAETGAMSGNIVLTASDLNIFEDGTLGLCDAEVAPDGTSGANNWAIDNGDEDGDGFVTTGIDTSHVIGAVDVVTGLDAGSTGQVFFYNGSVSCNGGGTSGNAVPFNFSAASPIAETNGTDTTTDVTRYQFDINGDIEPGENGFIEFRRRVN